MNRKSFLQQSSLLLAGLTLPAGVLQAQHNQRGANRSMVIPPYLRKGDTIGITCPAGYIETKDIQSAVQQITDWGFKVETGKTVGMRNGGLGGTDADRSADFQHMLTDRHIKAILCARGGYGVVRILDQLDFSSFRQHPKWVIGFSDITVLHCHIHNNYRVATLHSKMCNSFPDDWSKADAVQQDTILSIRRALTGEPMNYHAAYVPHNRMGTASGVLIGGNLRTIENLAATRSDIDTAGKILFVEDVHEKLYNIDRMFWSLKRTGKLKHLKGLIIGGFSVQAEEDPAAELPGDVYTIVKEKVKEYTYPVCFDFPVGHQRNNYALKCGLRHRLAVAENTFLQELR